MKRTEMMITLTAIGAALGLGIAQPASAEPQPLRIDSRHQPLVNVQPLPGGGFVVALANAGLETVSGRARLAIALEKAAAAACSDVRPLRVQQRCIDEMVASTTRNSGPEAVRALRLARQEAAASVMANNK